MTYEEALKQISSLLRFGIRPGLERIRKLLSLLGNPQDSLRFVHVAGTNGKGSTCALIASVLKEAGYRTGLYISPYITDFRERMQIDGKLIPRGELCALMERVMPIVRKMEENREGITEFELITALAMLWFSESKCDVVVLEVGMGGRLDATNVIRTPLVSVITSISLDHTAVLGDTPGKIAYEKSGIIKENGVTVCYPDQPPEALAVIRSTAAARRNRFVLADSGSVTALSENLAGTVLQYGPLRLTLPFLGEHQIKNAVTALAALEVLRNEGTAIPDRSLAEGFRKARFPARMEILSFSPLVVLDGAHNPGGIAALAEALKRYFHGRKLVAVMGMMADKDIAKTVELLGGLFSRVLTLTPSNPRAIGAEKLAQYWKDRGVDAQPEENIDAALKRAADLAGKDGAVVICGSLYLAGDVRPRALRLFGRK